MKFLAKIIAVLILSITVIACDNMKTSGTVSNTTQSTYTVTFSSQFNNIESTTTMPSPTSITVNSGGTVGTLPSEPTMSGYRFGGWWTGTGGTGTQFTAGTQVTSDMIVYAYWYNYKITFMSDSTTVLAVTMITTSTVDTLPAPPTKTGYTFAGWNTASNGSGTEFMANTPVAADTTVYAQWIANTNTVCAVTYNSNGGNAVGVQYVILSGGTGTVGALPANPTQLFYNFNGWFTAASGGAPFTASTPVTANITVYAQWTATPGSTVTYNSGWGTTVDAQYVIPPATTVGALPDPPTKPCYSFANWNTNSDGSGDVFDAGTTVGANIAVYAQWTWVGGTTKSTYAIGDPGPSCVGKVFYITDSGAHGLEAAPPGWSDWYAQSADPSAAWIYGGTTDDGNGGTYQKTQTTLNGNTSTGIGTYSAPIGLANSEAIIAQVAGIGGTTTPYAAQLCRDYSGGGLTDWFLPSRDELAQLYAQKDATRWGGFIEDRYWSSSEYDANDGWTQYFSTGAQQGTYKSYELLVRPVRAF